MSGGMVRRRMAHDRYKNKRMNTNPKKGPYHYTAPSRLFWKTVRGMLPHKTVRGAAAFERFKAYEGIPAPYDKVKRAVVPEALKVLRLGEGHRFCVLGDFCAQIGWKHAAIVKELEAKRAEAERRKAEADLPPCGRACSCTRGRSSRRTCCARAATSASSLTTRGVGNVHCVWLCARRKEFGYHFARHYWTSGHVESTRATLPPDPDPLT